MQPKLDPYHSIAGTSLYKALSIEVQRYLQAQTDTVSPHHVSQLKESGMPGWKRNQQRKTNATGVTQRISGYKVRR